MSYTDGSVDWLSWDEIIRIVQARRDSDSVQKQQMISLQRAYNGDYIVPLPDVMGSPQLQALAPTLISDAIDNRAMAAASYLPDVFCPAGKPTQATSMKKATIRQRAIQGWWNESKVGLILRRYYRHLGGYATGALVVEPDYTMSIPRIRLRNPLTAYPEPRAAEDVCPPCDVAFVYEKGAGECARMWPVDANGNDLAKYWKDLHESGKKVELVEWIDAEQICIGVMGTVDSLAGFYTTGGGTGAFALSQIPNRMGIAPISVGHAISMDRVQAHIVKQLGPMQWLDKLMGLETIQAEKSVFPDMYVIGKDGKMPILSGGRWSDGRSGEVNLISDASAIGQLVSPIGPAAAQVTANLERNVRVSTGNTSVYGGEMNGSVRSGQTITQLQGISSDPRVAEMHEIAENQFEQINRHMTNMSLKMFKSKTISLYSGRQGDLEAVTYTPGDDFDSDANKVTYPFPGSDINQVTVAVGQMKGADLMSQLQAMTLHPMVKNPQAELRQMTKETIAAAVKAGLAQQIAQGTVPLTDAAFIMDRLDKGDDLIAAINASHEAAQKRQAAQAPPPDVGMATAPEAQPGLAAPGQGVEAQPPPNQPLPPEGVDRLHQMLQAMRAPASSVA